MSTTSSFKAAKVISDLRKFCVYHHQPRKEAKEARKVKEYLRKKDGTLSKKYLVKWRCDVCRKLTEKPDMHHKDPVGKTPPWPYDIEELLAYMRRLLVPKDRWALLCKPCHKIETNREIKENVKKRAEEKNCIL